MFNELRTKRRMEKGASSSTMLAMEVQLNWLVNAFNNAIDAVAKEMKKSKQDGFFDVSKKMDSLYNVVFKRAPEEGEMVQELPSISTEPRDRNVQIPSTVTDTG